MKKLSAVALLVTLGLAAPALAQTPADVRNHRLHAVRDAARAERLEAAKPVAAEATETKAKKHAKKKKKKAKKQAEKVETKAEGKVETKKEEGKKH